jgi:hypothetical protein
MPALISTRYMCYSLNPAALYIAAQATKPTGDNYGTIPAVNTLENVVAPDSEKP